MKPLIKYEKAIEVAKNKPKGMVLSYENVLADIVIYAEQLEAEIELIKEVHRQEDAALAGHIKRLEAKLEAIECGDCEKSMLECRCDEESE